MLLIHCPYCEEARPEIELRYAGEAHIARSPDPMGEDDAAWAAYLYMRTNPRGWHRERWHHVHGCGRYFNALRHTVNDRIVATYRVGAPLPPVPGEPVVPAPVGAAPSAPADDRAQPEGTA